MAPLTNAEKMKRYREKLKHENKYVAHKLKHNEQERQSQRRKKKAISKLSKFEQETLLTERRRNIKERVSKCRHNKKMIEATKNTAHGSPAFKSAASLGKARSRAKKGFPDSPRKKRCVLKLLFESEFGPLTNAPVIHRRSSKINDETKLCVRRYFEQDDVSRQAPGRKDVVTSKRADGTKEENQARHLTSSLMETYALFKRDHSDMKIGKSKFIELKPNHVLLSNKLPHNVCLCKQHEDFINAAMAMHQHSNSFPIYSDVFTDLFLCDKPSEKCWLSNCDECSNLLKVKLHDIIRESNTPVKWIIWMQVEQGRLQKVLENGLASELARHILNMYPSFLLHVYIKHEQARAYKEERALITNAVLSTHKSLLQIDISENFTCISQDEIQSAHWHQNQVTLFTAALWHSGTLYPIVLVSDNLNHSKDTIIAYLDRLLEELPRHVSELSIWLDGPSSQFKNKYIAASLKSLQERFNLTIIWNFFATAHGKGPVDGIGGAVKRYVWRMVKTRKCMVYNASQFAKAAENSNVMVLEMSEDNIKQRNINLDIHKTFDNCSKLGGISKSHCMKNVAGVVSIHFLTKHAENEPIRKIREDIDDSSEVHDPSSISINDWYEVEYEGQIFPGIVTETCFEQGDFKVKVMSRVGKFWKWPAICDEIFYNQDKLIRKISPPSLVNQREHYTFNV